MKKNNDIVVGLGEIGTPLKKIFSKEQEVFGYDTNQKLMSPKEIKLIESKNNPPYEANYLNLDCSKSIKRLDWTPKLSIEQSISMTCAWYKNFYENPKNIHITTTEQIKKYHFLAGQRGLKWVKNF